MFRRKEDGTEILDESDNSVTPLGASSESTASFGSAGLSQAASASAPNTSSATTAPASAPAAPLFRPAAPAAAMAARAPQAPVVAASAPQTSSAQALSSGLSSTPKSSKRVLTVGPDIQMKGEITTCDRVVIEGAVDATLRDVHTVELAQSGTLKGTAEVEDAEISGSFEGDLLVRGRLIIYSTGVIRGNVTYGEIEIERGGQISGSLRNVDEASGAKGSDKRRAA